MSYEQVKDLRPADFKRYCGAQPETSRKMAEVISARLANGRRKAGSQPKLPVGD